MKFVFLYFILTYLLRQYSNDYKIIINNFIYTYLNLYII